MSGLSLLCRNATGPCYRPAGDARLRALTQDLLRLGIPEIDELARAAPPQSMAATLLAGQKPA